MDSRRLSGILAALAASFLWSLIGPMSKNCMADGVGPMEVAFWRAFLGCVCFALYAGMQKKLAIPWKTALTFMLFGALGTGVMFGALQVSIEKSGAAMGMVLLFTAPFWVAVFSRAIFKEHISGLKFIALAVALAGTIMVCMSGGSLGTGYSLMGIACGLLAGFCYATQFPFYVWWSPRYSTGTIYSYMLLGGSLIILLFTDFTAGKSAWAWGNLIGLGVVTNYIPYMLLGYSLQRISQVQTVVINNVEPVLSTLWAWMFFAENFSAIGWIGSLLILLAVFALTLEKAGRTPGAPA